MDCGWSWLWSSGSFNPIDGTRMSLCTTHLTILFHFRGYISAQSAGLPYSVADIPNLVRNFTTTLARWILLIQATLFTVASHMQLLLLAYYLELSWLYNKGLSYKDCFDFYPDTLTNASPIFVFLLKFCYFVNFLLRRIAGSLGHTKLWAESKELLDIWISGSTKMQ